MKLSPPHFRTQKKRLCLSKATGDVVLDVKTIVQTVAYSKKVAQAVNEYIENLPEDYVSPLLLDE